MTRLPAKFSRHPLELLARYKQELPKDLIKRMFELPYPADPVVEPELEGMTYGEVALYRQMSLAALGSRDALEMLLDRMIGKAANTNLNVNTTVTYQDFLDNLAQKEAPIDVTAEPQSDADLIS